MAMETVSDEQAVVFMFTKGREVQFTIGVASAKFEQLDGHLSNVQQPRELGRLRKENNNPVEMSEQLKEESSKATAIKQSPSVVAQSV